MFNYSEYRNIIKLVQSYLRIYDFKEVLNYNPSQYCVLRHDIEFSIDRALMLARIESDELGVKSTYTVQLRNNTYNALSQKNIEAIQEIEKLGHKIGLHQNPPPMEDDELVDYILKDIETLEHYYDFEVDRFAFHRCGSNPEILEKYVEVPNKINCYGKEFFHYFKGPRPDKLDVHYLADSNHQWKYGHPMHIDYSKYPWRMQLLTHPFSWTENGYENMNNFTRLIRERTDELVNDMNSETTTFPKELMP
jgi:hypothetical protein|tara:strand:- start:8073 stop:8822 length:750 start_codon:yes stop_codon:yes gene_type:complete